MSIVPEKYNKPGILAVKMDNEIVALSKSKNMKDRLEQLLTGDDTNSKRIKYRKDKGVRIGFDVVTEGYIEPFEQEKGYEWEPEEEWFIWLNKDNSMEFAGIRYDAEIKQGYLRRLAFPEWIIPEELVRNRDKILRVV